MRSHSRGWSRTRAISSLGSLLRRIDNSVKILKKDLSDTAHKTRERHAGPSVKERQEQLVAFYEGYEDFVEMLCDAAQYGPTPRLETGYQTRRAALAERYAEMKPLLSAFIRPDAGQTEDVFEALLSASTVSDFLQSDDGETIARITRARQALNFYAEHLRHLAERTG